MVPGRMVIYEQLNVTVILQAHWMTNNNSMPYSQWVYPPTRTIIGTEQQMTQCWLAMMYSFSIHNYREACSWITRLITCKSARNHLFHPASFKAPQLFMCSQKLTNSIPLFSSSIVFPWNYNFLTGITIKFYW